jgi:hypothetical protein
MRELCATPILPLHVGDDATDLEHAFNKWCSKVISYLCKVRVRAIVIPNRTTRDSGAET